MLSTLRYYLIQNTRLYSFSSIFGNYSLFTIWASAPQNRAIQRTREGSGTLQINLAFWIFKIQMCKHSQSKIKYYFLGGSWTPQTWGATFSLTFRCHINSGHFFSLKQLKLKKAKCPHFFLFLIIMTEIWPFCKRP